jgi:hypothetical protein
MFCSLHTIWALPFSSVFVSLAVLYFEPKIDAQTAIGWCQFIVLTAETDADISHFRSKYLNFCFDDPSSSNLVHNDKPKR